MMLQPLLAAALQFCRYPLRRTDTKLTTLVPQFLMRVGVWGVDKVPRIQLVENADGTAGGACSYDVLSGDCSSISVLQVCAVPQGCQVRRMSAACDLVCMCKILCASERIFSVCLFAHAMMIAQESVRASEQASVQASAREHVYVYFTVCWRGGRNAAFVVITSQRQQHGNNEVFDGTATTEHAAMARGVGPGAATRCG